MKTQLKFMAVLVGASLAVLATVFSAFASTPGLQRAGTLTVSAAPAALGVAERAAACTKMTASEVAWVTLTEDGEIDEQVDAYESGTTVITPYFEYNCVPKKTTIVSVFSLDGEQIYSDKEPLKANNAKGGYGYPLSTTDESPVDEGTWSVEFYNNKTLLTSGEIVVGEGGGGSSAVTLQGTVKDAKTKKAIKGAIVLVLQPGVTIDKFIKGGQKDSDVYTAGQTDSKGQFVLPDQLERSTEYSLIAVAKGYKPVGQDKFVVADSDPDPLDLNITLKK
jgi:hypothetical protein